MSSASACQHRELAPLKIISRETADEAVSEMAKLLDAADAIAADGRAPSVAALAKFLGWPKHEVESWREALAHSGEWPHGPAQAIPVDRFRDDPEAIEARRRAIRESWSPREARRRETSRRRWSVPCAEGLTPALLDGDDTGKW